MSRSIALLRRLVPTKEAAELLGVKPGTLWGWAKTNRAPVKPYVMKVGRREVYRWDPDAIVDAIRPSGEDGGAA